MITVRAKIASGEYVNLTLDETSGKYKALMQVPNQTSYYQPGQYFPITFEAFDGEDSFIADDTDPTFGQALRVRVREKTTPIIDITSPVITNESEMYIEFDITDLGGSLLNYSTVNLHFGDYDFDLNHEYMSLEEIEAGVKIHVTFNPPYHIQDGIYDISIQAQDYDENLSVLDFTYEVATDVCSFIIDRTQADVDLVNELRRKYLDGTITEEERALYATNLKGARNKADFERIITNMDYLAVMFDVTGYSMPELPEIPTGNYVQALRDNVELFRNSVTIHPTTPQTPKLPINTYKKMNDLEKILFDVHDNLKYRFKYYCADDDTTAETDGFFMYDDTTPDFDMDKVIGTLE